MHKGAYDLFMIRNPESQHVDSLPLTEFRKNDGGRLVARLDTSHKSGTPDTAKGYGNVGVDLHNYVFSNNPNDNRSMVMQGDHKPAAEVVTDYKDTSGQYAIHQYKTVFTPDVIIGSAGYSGFFGLQGTTQMLFFG